MFMQLHSINYSAKYHQQLSAHTEISIGTNVLLQQNKNAAATEFPIPDYRLLDGGLFIYTKWKYNKWSISGGIRYDIRKIDWNDLYGQE